MAFFTDLPCSGYTWRLPVMMKRCLNCKACLVSCPIGAIDKHRFLLHAERCLTFHNEHAGDFPDFINPSVHHCLFGCMKCQNVCPENRVKDLWFEEKERFSEFETSFILNKNPLNKMPLSTRNKLERLSIIDDFSLLSRNLYHCLNVQMNI